MQKLIFKNILLILFFNSLIFSCNSNSVNDPQLVEAAAIHEEALKIGEDVQPLIKELVQRRNSLSIQGRALTQEEQNFVDRIYALESSFENWKNNHIEVPGANHTGHNHENGSKLNLPPSEMLSMQKGFKDSILVIKERAEKLSRN